MFDPFQPVEIVNPNGRAEMLIIVDHASNALPDGYGTIGLPAGDFERHIAYDIGTAGVARALATLLDVPAILSGFSRLLIDPNRGEDDPTLVMQISDGAIIPGNRRIDPQERARRLDTCYRPYHTAIETFIARAPAPGPAIVSLHSFTPQLLGRAPRPWHAGVLWGPDEASGTRLIDLLRRDGALCVGANEPYNGGNTGECLDQHAFGRGLPNVLLEIRNDLIDKRTGQEDWAGRLAGLLPQVFASP